LDTLAQLPMARCWAIQLRVMVVSPRNLLAISAFCLSLITFGPGGQLCFRPTPYGCGLLQEFSAVLIAR
jgi:hypothetical protein